MMRQFSVIIPVFNRPQEVNELLESLVNQTFDNFEVLVIEDGSTRPCLEVVKKYAESLDIRYFYKENSGSSDSRNYGMAKARAPFMIFFDSDCIIPSHYFERVQQSLTQNNTDAYGGPDNAHSSFTRVQKAINHAMTSRITTGGIRGKKNKMDHYQPRSFNMGLSREVYGKVGGFSDAHIGEDIDLSYRIRDAGFSVRLIEEAYVFHKRRVNFRKFATQVYRFGVGRTILMKRHPGKFKLVYAFPSIFLLGSLTLILLALFLSVGFLLPLLLLALLIGTEAFIKTRSIPVAFLAMPASFLQLYGYGFGFLTGYAHIFLLGKNEKKAFPDFFFRESGHGAICLREMPLSRKS